MLYAKETANKLILDFKLQNGKIYGYKPLEIQANLALGVRKLEHCAKFGFVGEKMWAIKRFDGVWKLSFKLSSADSDL